ncbi:MAG: CDP-diacylglycerol--glycerol-3-phosphate 3-phosphatidyltransferase [Acetivibrionales bacterium]|nr:CDP-diacylglycerol--glycerol-3-phosphate 3-phosphatidyltransferase [Clostridiaceae bacterium]
MNLPNKITVSRILATPVFLFFLVPGWFGQFWGLDQWGRYAAAVIFIVASITDMVDGNIARKYNMITELGKFLDPIADKLLVTSALIAFIKTDNLSVWAVFIIIAREFIITGFRVVAAGRGVVIAADKWGKIKTVVQIAAIIAILIKNFPVSLIIDFPLGMVLMYIAVALTVISGVNYIVKNVKVLEKN